jgi:hypothetical protein
MLVIAVPVTGCRIRKDLAAEIAHEKASCVERWQISYICFKVSLCQHCFAFLDKSFRNWEEELALRRRSTNKGRKDRMVIFSCVSQRNGNGRCTSLHAWVSLGIVPCCKVSQAQETKEAVPHGCIVVAFGK